MRYFYEKEERTSHYGEIFVCRHPVYTQCTLYRIREKGLAVIQQRFEPVSRRTYWSEIDPELTDAIYLNPGFRGIFGRLAGEESDGLYPTVTVRKLMWALRMKPLPKQRWETVFDRQTV